MAAGDVIAVVGVCAPERRRFAKLLAEQTGAALFPAGGLVGSPDPAREAAILATWSSGTAGSVIEFPSEAVATELIGALAAADDSVRLRALICVVDASHVLEDLFSDEYLPVRDEESGVKSPLVARAELAMRQIEYASVVVLVNWEPLKTSSLAAFMALISNITPRARLHLAGARPLSLGEMDVYGIDQDRAGWTCVLNGDHTPHMTDRRVTTVHYEEPRPLHPERLMTLLDRIEAGEFGRVVRSAGFCRLATRSTTIAHWEHVGSVITLAPVAVDARLGPEDEILAVGQDLAFIGLDLDAAALARALDDVSLTTDELLAGPGVWSSFLDPFPAWSTASHRHE